MKELSCLHAKTHGLDPVTLQPDSVNALAGLNSELMEVRAEFEPGDASEVVFTVSSGTGRNGRRGTSPSKPRWRCSGRRDRRHCPSLATGLVDGGQRHRKERGVFHVIETHDAHILRHANARRLQGAQESGGGVVVGADEGIGPPGGKRTHKLHVGGVPEANPVGGRLNAAAHQGFARSGDASIHGRRGQRASQEADSLAAEP